MMRAIRSSKWVVPMLAAQFLLLLVPVSAAAVWTQEQPSDAKPLLETVAAADFKLLAGRLEKYLAEPEDSKKKFDYRTSFEKVVEDLESKYDEPLLRDTDFVSAVLAAGSTYTRERASSKGRVKDFTTQEEIAGEKYEATFWLWIPRSYTEDTSWPLIVGLHPEGKDGRWYLEEILDDETLRENYIIVCPSLGKGEKWFDLPGLIKLFPRTIKVVWESYNVDRKKVFLDGFADGGEAAWQILASFRDVFAGGIIRSAAPGDALIEGNLMHVPVFFAVGSDDKSLVIAELRTRIDALKQAQVPIEMTEVAGKGKETFAELNPKIVEWLADKTRADYPTSIAIRTTGLQFGRGFWIEIRKTETGLNEATGKPYTAKLEATYDRKQNRIEITAENVYKVEILLNDTIVDMAQPFSVWVNKAEKWTGTKERSWRFLLDKFHESGDWSRVFTNSLEVDIE